MKKLSLIIAAIFVFGVGNVVKADDNGTDQHLVTIGVSELALVDIEPVLGTSTTISLSPSINEAGEALNFTNSTSSNLRLNYSSIVGGSSASNTIKAKYTGSLPAGIKLKLQVGTCTTGGGNRGAPANNGNEILLSSTDNNVVEDIGSSFTGDGGSNGHLLTYSLELDGTANYEDIVQDSQDITIIYTITNN